MLTPIRRNGRACRFSILRAWVVSLPTDRSANIAGISGRFNRSFQASSERERKMSGGRVKSGASAPLGATVHDGGVNFSVFSKDAALVELLLFDDANAIKPAKVIPLNANKHHTHHYWHVFMPEVQRGQVYAYRAHGSFAPERGWRFDADKVLVDPYARAIAVPDRYDRWAAARPGDNTATSMKSVVADPDCYDWQGDLPL